MSKDQKLALVWKHTHRNYRGKINGERAIMIYVKGQGTCLVPLIYLTDEEIDQKLPRQETTA